MGEPENTGIPERAGAVARAGTATRAGAGSGETSGDRRLSYLDQALWQKLADAETVESFARYWLTLQCRMIGGAIRAGIVLGPAGTGPFTPVASWPEGDAGTEGQAISIKRAVAERRGVVYGHGADRKDGEGTCFAAYPFLIENRVHGAIALEIEDRGEAELRAVMRDLQWGAAWMEMWHWRQAGSRADTIRTRAALSLDLVATAVGETDFDTAALAVVTELAARMNCERVSVGFLRRGTVAVAAISHTARFGKRTSLLQAIGAAMNEAVDQRTTILDGPSAKEAFLVTSAHQELREGQKITSVLTIPFGDERRLSGAIAFERASDEAFSAADLLELDLLASTVGPILEARRRESRWIIQKIADAARVQARRMFGPRYLGRKLALAIALICFGLGYAVTDVYRVTADASVEGMVRRAVVAPFEGYILIEAANAGDTVAKGDLLAELDVYDIALKRLRMVSARAQHMAEYNQALAERKAADVNVIQAQIDQADAEIALYDEQISRAKLRAPFDGIILSGDLSQSVGSAVSRGDVLFELSPLDAYRVILRVDDRQIRDVETGQGGSLLLSSLPDAPLPITISAITPVSDARDGRNVFRVEARLDETIDRLRPGMEGVAKIDIAEQRLIWIWVRPVIDWFRLQFWAWLP